MIAPNSGIVDAVAGADAGLSISTSVPTESYEQDLLVEDYLVVAGQTAGALAANLTPFTGTGNSEIDGYANAAHAFFFYASIHTAVIAVQPELTPYAAPQAIIGFGSGGYFTSKIYNSYLSTYRSNHGNNP